MYESLKKWYLQAYQDFPTIRRPLVGAIIQETRVSKGIPQYRFSKSTGINLSTLKSIENDHLLSTSIANIQKCAHELNVPLEQLVLDGRERDPANFFVYKRQPPLPIEGLRQKKKSPPSWRKTLRFEWHNCQITPLTPPIFTQKDFFSCRLTLPPKRAIENLELTYHEQVIGFISEGFNIQLRCGNQSPFMLTSNKSFILDGAFSHSLVNLDEETDAVIYLVTKLKALPKQQPDKIPFRRGSFDIGRAIEELRNLKSSRAEKSLSLRHLADLTDTLDDNKIRLMMKLKKGSSVVSWDKVEDLLGATRTSMEDFLSLANGEAPLAIKICTAQDRAMIDYSHYYGMRIYSVIYPSSDNHFHCGELHMEPSREGRVWQRKDNAMIAIDVQEGELRVQAGKNRLAVLNKGESVCFDGSLGYLISNLSQVPAKCFFATHPAIRY